MSYRSEWSKRGARYLSCSLALLGLSACYNDGAQYRGLAEHPSETIGKVRHLNCADHGAVYYEFEVAGKSQAGRAPLGMINCRSAEIGQKVRVYYDPSDPRIHTMQDPRRPYEQERGYYLPAWLLFVLGFPLYLTVVALVGKYQSGGKAGP